VRPLTSVFELSKFVAVAYLHSVCF